MIGKSATAAIAAAGVLLSGCSGGTIFKKTQLGDVQVLSIDARQRLVLVGTDPRGRRIVCAEPSPDAIVARAEAFAAHGIVPVGSNAAGATNTVDAALGASSGESAASIAMRTQTIQLLRDGYYRLCEGLMNGAIEPQKYQLIVSNIDAFMAVLVAVDGLSGGGRAPAVGVVAGSTAGVIDGSPNTSTSPSVTIEQVTTNATAMIPEQAAAIRDITLTYFALVRDRNRIYRASSSEGVYK
ncbi:hypothetical protein BH10PSE7_BH10PSE7_08580 [soil metagenome]